MFLSRLSILSVLFLLFAAPHARAAAGTDLLTDSELTLLEARAEHAIPKERCFLYTELVQNYTQIAGRQLAAGETEKAGATLKRIQSFAASIHTGLAKDTRRLKDAEMLMHTAARSLGEFLHHASDDDKVAVESTLKQLEKVNEELLAQVFAH